MQKKWAFGHDEYFWAFSKEIDQVSGRKKKLTWEDVYRDFKSRHPKLGKTALGFEPYSYATILIMFPDRVRRTYDYDTKKLIIVKKEN